MTKTRVIAVMMVLVMVAGFTMGAEKGSETFRASCLVKVSADRSVIQLDNTMTIIEYLVQSSGVAGRARADVLQVPQDDIGECFSILIEPLAVDTTSGARPAATRTRATTSRTPKETSPQMMGGMMMPGMPSGGMGGMGGGLMDIPVPKKPTSTARTRSSSSSSRIGGGMGGYGGGMMGGMGGIGGGMGGYGGGTTTRPATPTRSTGTRPAAGNDDQTLLFKLEVDLTDCDKPVAEEFLAAVVENLENAFLHAYEMRLEQLEMQLHQAMEQHEKMVAAIDKKAGRTEEDKETEEQLETKVDLSELNVDTTLKNAVEMIRKSVDPPLKLIVMWTDLENNAFIQQDTPVGCSGEGLYNVPLRAGLDRVLASVGGGLSDISYSIKDGIVTVATEESTSYYTYVVSDSISGPSRYAPFEYSDAELETLYDQKQSWLKEEYSIQMESARMKARSRAIEKQLPKLRDSVQVQMSNDTVSLNIESIIGALEDRLTATKKSVEAGMAGLDAIMEMQEKISRARIELARRKEELGDLGGGDRIRGFSRELIELAIEIEQGETFRVAIVNQLLQIEEQIAQAHAVNEKTARHQHDIHTLERTRQRINQLESEINTLARPSITVIGGK